MELTKPKDGATVIAGTESKEFEPGMECIILMFNHKRLASWTGAKGTCTYQYVGNQHLSPFCCAEAPAACGLSAHVEVAGCSTLRPSRPKQCHTDPRSTASSALQPPQTALSAMSLYTMSPKPPLHIILQSVMHSGLHPHVL